MQIFVMKINNIDWYIIPVTFKYYQFLSEACAFSNHLTRMKIKKIALNFVYDIIVIEIILLTSSGSCHISVVDWKQRFFLEWIDWQNFTTGELRLAESITMEYCVNSLQGHLDITYNVACYRDKRIIILRFEITFFILKWLLVYMLSSPYQLLLNWCIHKYALMLLSIVRR